MTVTETDEVNALTESWAALCRKLDARIAQLTQELRTLRPGVPRTHELACWPEPFDAVVDGRKRFEWRRDERGYAVGDWLLLRKWDPTSRQWVADAAPVRVRVTYILRGQFEVPEPFVVLGISDPEVADGD